MEAFKNTLPIVYNGFNQYNVDWFLLVPIALSNLVISEQDTTTINWKAPQNKCPVIDYAVQFQLVNRDRCRVVNGEFETVANASLREFTLRDADSSLYAYSTYKIRVLARNEAGLGEYQDENHIEYTTSAKGNQPNIMKYPTLIYYDNTVFLHRFSTSKGSFICLINVEKATIYNRYQ